MLKKYVISGLLVFLMFNEAHSQEVSCKSVDSRYLESQEDATVPSLTVVKVARDIVLDKENHIGKIPVSSGNIPVSFYIENVELFPQWKGTPVTLKAGTRLIAKWSPGHFNTLYFVTKSGVEIRIVHLIYTADDELPFLGFLMNENILSSVCIPNAAIIE